MNIWARAIEIAFEKLERIYTLAFKWLAPGVAVFWVLGAVFNCLWPETEDVFAMPVLITFIAVLVFIKAKAYQAIRQLLFPPRK